MPATTAAKHATNRNPIAYLKRQFHNVIRRTTGLDPHTPRSVGLPLDMSQADFVGWALCCTPFLTLHRRWVRSGYQRSASPSIDRVDDMGGYTKANLRFVSWVDNQRKPKPRLGRPVTAQGQTHNLAAWARILGCRLQTLSRRRCHGWSDEETIAGRRRKPTASVLDRPLDALSATLPASLKTS
jgi:hypothetical protein